MCNWELRRRGKEWGRKEIFEDILGENYQDRIENSKIYPQL